MFSLLNLLFYLASIFLFNDPNSSLLISPFISSNDTNLRHLVFGLIGSEKTWYHRKNYIESWWRPKVTRGYLLLDVSPSVSLLPWSKYSPPYKVSTNITKLLQETQHVAPIQARMVHGIMEIFEQEHEGVRWLIMGGDDSIFFLENLVDVLAKYDHNKYYYFGASSECILSNFWDSFNQGYGVAGFIMSFPSAKDIESCLRRYPNFKYAHHITMACIVDLGIDMHGYISGLLASHPKAPLMSLHHFDAITPIFPSMDRTQSIEHYMKEAKFDQSRILQQIICHHRPSNWTFSVSWGYSIHIYEKIMPRSHLIKPIQTFKTWIKTPKPPYYIYEVFCERFLEIWNKNEIRATYFRSTMRWLPDCPIDNNHLVNYVNKIQVYSPRTKRIEMDRCEYCDIIHKTGGVYNGESQNLIRHSQKLPSMFFIQHFSGQFEFL
ncbi:hypothetical protein H5410_063797 [Solanum commersonii]|uniref:Uncharacterized protein n=1 Tax=Solanum commersonii TaxID=4109 RepID=A0A9J5WFA5_SOLCO|nr:hypothetical protein H5410_063797 [Solanum commersonii]